MSTHPALSILDQPDFLANVEKFRGHFGTSSHEPHRDGYTFLQLPKNTPGHPSAKAPRAAVQKPVSAVSPSTSHATHATAQAARAPARPALATQVNTTSTFDHLMKLVTTNSPPATTAVSGAKHGDAAIVHTPTTHKTVLASEAQDRANAVLRPPLPAHLRINVPELDSLKRMREEMQTMNKTLEQRNRALASQKQASKAARQTNGTVRTTSTEGSRVSRCRASVQTRPPMAATGVKRMVPSDFTRIRRGLIDAIKNGSVITDPFAMDICDDEEALSPDNRRVRKEPVFSKGDSDRRVRESAGRTRSRSTTRQRSRERQRSRDRDNRAHSRESRDGNPRSRDRGRESIDMGDELQASAGSVSMQRTPSTSSVAMSVTESVGSRNEQHCVGYYIESLVCCVESFWSMSAISDLKMKSDQWNSIMQIYRFPGLAALIMACAYHQLSINSNHLATVLDDDAGMKRAVADTRKYFLEMNKWENMSRQMLTAEVLSREFPRTWNNCLLPISNLDQFELRSRPNTEFWPAVAYPVGPTSNPLDIANFARQVNREWLESQGLSLRMPDNMHEF
ncbi:hypothetical protein DL89DRAFT_265676 [Linderina pennispora]|uniref:Uncharacterized protein n=1 Tax=Linderina pennispora TaxID=61395 RepID=A0A1Y1WES8_9FUNG|nr:uncharacterized protein DL89DRAFT_265676 [Linderina pennispora]ORX71993.1 hypothetical protein DL89DRAFT_265676 [Linderina pennispora]